MTHSALQLARQAAGLTQAELAERAGVSRQMVGAIEAGRHLPRVDAALTLAAALEADVISLFAPQSAPVDVVSGIVPDDGAMVRIGRVGDLAVTALSRVGTQGWDVADGVIEGGILSPFGRRAPGLVIAGCEPGLEVLERLLRERGSGAISVATSSQSAIEALAAGRAHAAVVHGPDGVNRESEDLDVDVFRFARWRVGLAATPDSPRSWWRGALSGDQKVIQRERGAGVQRAFDRATNKTGMIDGPVVGSHLEAAQLAMATGMPAVTIEPAALAVGASFHALETHEADIWIARQWSRSELVMDALDLIVDTRFRRRLESVGGYDLDDIGTRVA
jgi:DNA-binding XRE family transcriptional regulator/molybdate-binding protein